ncbi:hypothetical protein [Psittacicella hinzii]|uniref:Uncharacterized protein n=1 Tax=Psittacicella hinzii TaxID=2028575 RepID=A0A3A1YFY1_9GAMM|nr:hypothetical protein [Psittacicella hinzii]RIY36199.1 hypothetical protein CKF58_06050 [Psittacicella hinzii]
MIKREIKEWGLAFCLNAVLGLLEGDVDFAESANLALDILIKKLADENIYDLETLKDQIERKYFPEYYDSSYYDDEDEEYDEDDYDFDRLELGDEVEITEYSEQRWIEDVIEYLVEQGRIEFDEKNNVCYDVEGANND